MFLISEFKIQVTLYFKVALLHVTCKYYYNNNYAYANDA